MLFQEFIFQQDKIPPLKSKTISNILQGKNKRVLHWPVYTSDPNSMQNFCDY